MTRDTASTENHAPVAQRMRPRARLMLTIGRDLISSETVALTELVKNSFDADADTVLVRLTGPVVDGQIAPGTGCVEVLDNGTGMSADRIAETWLVPATDFRKNSPLSAKGRRTLGEKGVGRFAAAKLAETLTLSSRPDSTDEVTVKVDWSEFDQPDKYLDEVDVEWSVGTPQLFSPTGRVSILWSQAWSSHFDQMSGSTPPPQPSSEMGTYIEMNNLLDRWDSDSVAAVRRSLARLISPFSDQITESMTIILEVPPELGAGGVIGPPDELDRPHYRLDATVDSLGNVAGTIRTKTEAEAIPLTLRLVNADGEFFGTRRPLACGPFALNLRVWDRDEKSLAQLGASVKSVRQTLDEASGISVYRDGFRVLPYGEQGDDWLRLDLRRVQNPTMRLSNNQIVGYLAIGRDTNPDLVDQTNREGLVVGAALDDLRSAVRQILAELETVRYAERPRSPSNKNTPGGLLDPVDLTELTQTIAARLPKDGDVANMLTRLQTQIHDKTEEVGRALARYRRMATVGTIVDQIMHEIYQPVFVIRTHSRQALKSIDQSSALFSTDECQPLVNDLTRRFETIRDQGHVIAAIIKRIEPFGGRQRGKPTTFELEAAIRNVVDLLHPDIERVGATIEVPSGATRVAIDGAELQEVLVNLIQNSLYWLAFVEPPSTRKIVISVDRLPDHSLAITHEDSGPGVPVAVRDRVFEPYFTTREGGAGLGLAIAGEIVEDFYGGTLELLEPGELGGARFRAILRKRVTVR